MQWQARGVKGGEEEEEGREGEEDAHWRFSPRALEKGVGELGGAVVVQRV